MKGIDAEASSKMELSYTEVDPLLYSTLVSNTSSILNPSAIPFYPKRAQILPVKSNTMPMLTHALIHSSKSCTPLNSEIELNSITPFSRSISNPILTPTIHPYFKPIQPIYNIFMDIKVYPLFICLNLFVLVISSFIIFSLFIGNSQCKYLEAFSNTTYIESDINVVDNSSMYEFHENASEILKNIKMKNVNRLVIGQININSIRNKFEFLKEVVKNYIDILIITETKIDSSFSKNQFSIKGYKEPFRKDLDTNGGGVMIFVRDDLACRELRVLKNNGEGLFLELNLRKTKWLLFGGYNHNKNNIKKFLSEFSDTLEFYLSTYEHFLFTGDWNSEVVEADMKAFCETYNLKSLIMGPTVLV